eukprot:3826517-Prymnesium_polylepis.1
MASEGNGAIVDGQHRSSFFLVQSGARLWMYSLTLANGFTDGSGGAAMIQRNAEIFASNVSIVNSTALTS